MKAMMSSKPDGGRVLLAMDSSPRSKAALQMAVALAAQLDTELVGLYVEDINLFRLSSLPFTTEIGFFSAGPSPINPENIERALQREAGEVRNLLAEAAGRLSLKWSFHVMRGHIATELFSYANALDLMVLGKGARFGLKWFAEVPMQPSAMPGPVVAMFDGSPAACRALGLAKRIVMAGGWQMKLLFPTDDKNKFFENVEKAKALLAEIPLQKTSYYQLHAGDVGAFAETVRTCHASVLVLCGNEQFRNGPDFYTLLNEIDCPVVLVG